MKFLVLVAVLSLDHKVLLLSDSATLRNNMTYALYVDKDGEPAQARLA